MNRDSDVTPPQDEGGLRPPPGLSLLGRIWWWFDFLILVKLARLRFVAVLLVIGIMITQWDKLIARYDKWTRPTAAAGAASGGFEYFCPMHPAVVRDNPKEKCPICFMPLSKRKKGEGHEEPLPAGVVNRVQLSPYRVVLAGVETWPVDYLPLTKEISTVGFIEFNERGQKTVAARVDGRIDKLFISETGQMVQVGDDLALLYSPELFTTAQNLLDARRGGNRAMEQGSRTRLELLGIAEEQLDELTKSGKATTQLKIRSPIKGHIISKYAREGQYVKEGTALYDLADLSTVWIAAQVYEEDLPFLSLEHHPETGALTGPSLSVRATTRAFPNEEFQGKLTFIYPHVDQDTRTLTIRFELDNPGHKLRPGATANVKLRVSPKDLAMLAPSGKASETAREMLEQGRMLAVPERAVIDTGSQTIVYREASPGVFEGVLAQLGPRMAGPEGAAFFPVLAGLQAGERVVTTGSFLVDAETRLNPAAGSIYFAGSSRSDSETRGVTRPSTPESPDAKIRAALGKLAPADRKLAEAQRFCPILNSRLGSMGPPIKIMLDGQPVLLCCAGCRQKATAEPEKTLAKVKQLKEAGTP